MEENKNMKTFEEFVGASPEKLKAKFDKRLETVKKSVRKLHLNRNVDNFSDYDSDLYKCIKLLVKMDKAGVDIEGDLEKVYDVIKSAGIKKIYGELAYEYSQTIDSYNDLAIKKNSNTIRLSEI